MEKSNRLRLELIARALGELRTQVVFVGGSVAQLYADDSASAEPRPTMDVDIIVDLSSYSDYNKFCEELRSKRFSNDISAGAPICRWTFESEILDVMPTEDTIIGESNRWYKSGFQHRKVYEISQGLIIQILPAPFYLATKLEAIKNRGGADLRVSHDFEDLIYVLNYCQGIVEQVEQSDENLKEYFGQEFALLLSRSNIREEISCMLPYGEERRCDNIIKTMNTLTSYGSEEKRATGIS